MAVTEDSRKRASTPSNAFRRTSSTKAATAPGFGAEALSCGQRVEHGAASECALLSTVSKNDAVTGEQKERVF